MADINKNTPLELSTGEHHELLVGNTPLELSTGEHHELLAEPEHRLELGAGREPQYLAPSPSITDATTIDGIDYSDTGSLVGLDTITPEAQETNPLVTLPASPVSPLSIVGDVHSTESKKYSWIFFCVIGLIIAIIVGVLWFLFPIAKKEGYFTYTLSSEAPKTFEEGVEQKIQENERYSDIMNRAIQEQDITLCEGISVTSEKGICLESVQGLLYTLSGTIDDCKKLTITDIQHRCLATVAKNSALNTMDKSLCDQIPDNNQTQDCRENIDQKILINLIETKTATEENCNTLEENNIATCRSNIIKLDDSQILQDALKANNREMCDTLSSIDLKHSCSDTISIRNAINLGDIEVCEDVFDEKKRNACITTLSAQSDNTIFQDAIIDKNKNLCSTIKNATLQSRCYDSITLLLIRESGNREMCDTLSNTGMIASCRTSFANQ